MSKSYRYLQYDVFTDRLFGGNQLAVFLDGRGLSTATMQAIANEMKFSETTFILPPEQPGTDVRMRIFTPTTELAMAGHPTIGSTFALARTGVIGLDRDRWVFGLGVGPTPVSLTWRGANLGFVWMTQLNPTFGEPIADPAGAAAMLGLPRAAVAGTGLPLQVVSCGVPFLFVPLTTRTAVDHAVIGHGPYEKFFRSSKIQATGVFVFSTEPRGERATAYSRMFAPRLRRGRGSGDGWREWSAWVLSRAAQGRAPQKGPLDVEPARGADGPAQPHPHLDWRGRQYD
jgi:trans-2,3-dihydro-3-hydroxyanthranilate isomerase